MSDLDLDIMKLVAQRSSTSCTMDEAVPIDIPEPAETTAGSEAAKETTAKTTSTSPRPTCLSQPGAFAVAPLNLPSDVSHESQSSEEESSDADEEAQTISVEDNDGRDNDGLAVANPVSQPDLPQAELEDFDRDLEGEQVRKQQRPILVLAACLVVVVAASAIGVLHGTKASPDPTSQDIDAPGLHGSNDSEASPSSEDSFLSLISQETIFAISETGSPQAKAFQWLREDEDFALLSSDRILQKYALATLYYATNGDKWEFRDGWLDHSVHECRWFGKADFAMKDTISGFYPGYMSEFFPPSEPPATTCDTYGTFQNLWLDKNMLVGTLPPELYLLTSLKTLSVGFNKLEKGISSHVGKLTSLEGLAASFLKNGSPIPSEIGLLTKLRGISLSTNNHQGSIPTELWKLTNLETLALSFNAQLRGTIPSQIGTLSNMRWLTLAGTGLTGSVPSEIGKLKNLEWIGLGGNKLTGMIPTELGLLSNLLLLSLFDNAFTGTIPTQLGALTATQHFLSIRNNRLSGTIPSEFGRLTEMTLALDLQDNQLTGTVPTELGLLTELRGLSLQNNAMFGTLPSQLGELSSMGLLNMANNSFSGTIPPEVSSLWQSLHTVSLEGNDLLYGVVPKELCTINGTCISNSLHPCEAEETYGLTFGCTDLLCGCGCDCA